MLKSPAKSGTQGFFLLILEAPPGTIKRRCQRRGFSRREGKRSEVEGRNEWGSHPKRGRREKRKGFFFRIERGEKKGK
jgi:hypothetical protein